MPDSSAVHSFSTKLELDEADNDIFVEVVEVVDVEQTTKVGTVKKTNLNSPSAALEKGPGMIDAGMATFTMRGTKVQFNKLFTTYIRKTKEWRISWPLVGAETTPSRFKFMGHLTSIGQTFPNAEDNGTVDCKCEIDITGLPTFASGT